MVDFWKVLLRNLGWFFKTNFERNIVDFKEYFFFSFIFLKNGFKKSTYDSIFTECFREKVKFLIELWWNYLKNSFGRCCDFLKKYIRDNCPSYFPDFSEYYWEHRQNINHVFLRRAEYFWKISQRYTRGFVER